MKKIPLFFVILVVMLVVSKPVGASVLRQVTVTPSPTFIPPSPTPTPFPFACPVGTPLGWGTYTPSPLWNTTCGSCASIPTSTGVPTSTASPVPTWDGTGTPPVTASPTITITPTVTVSPTPSPLFACQTITGTTCELSGNANTITYYLDKSTSNGSTQIGTSGYTSIGLLDSDHGSTHNDMYVSYNVTISYTDSTQPGIPYNHKAYGEIRFTVDGYTNGGLFDELWVETTSNPSRTYSATNMVTRLDGADMLFQTNAEWGETSHIDGFITFSSFPISAATPTPTVTPQYVSTYCSSVAPVYDDFGFDLFINDGEPFCDMGWEEWEITEELVMPAVQICLQPVRFGVIRMMAVDFEMGTYGLVVAAAYFLRWLRTV